MLFLSLVHLWLMQRLNFFFFEVIESVVCTKNFTAFFAVSVFSSVKHYYYVTCITSAQVYYNRLGIKEGNEQIDR